MSAAPDTSAIEQLIRRARTRIRCQGALEGAVTGLILAAVTAMVSVFAMRTELVSPTVGLGLLGVAAGWVVGGALLGALRTPDDEVIARRIDRASNLADRLSTAVAFRRTLASGHPISDPDTHDMMVAAIVDGARAVPRAKVALAAPFRVPRDFKAALGFLAVSALAAGLAVPAPDRTPRLFAIDPDYGRPGDQVTLRGRHLMTTSGSTPTDTYVYLGQGTTTPVEIVERHPDNISIRIPANAPIGETTITVSIADTRLGPLPFTVVAVDDPRIFSENAVVLDPDERAYVESIIAQLKELAQREKLEDLDKFIAKIEQLLKDVQLGKVTKEQLLAELAKAEELLNKGAEPDQQELAKRMSELGKELQKSDTTKDLGKALEKNEMDKAKEELEKLARKLEKSAQQKELEELEKQLKDPKLSEKEKAELQKKIDQLKKEMTKELDELKEKLADKDNKLTEQEKQELQKKIDQLKQEQKDKPLSDQQKQELQKQLEQAAKQMQKQEQKSQEQMAQQRQNLEKQIRELQKKQQEAKTEQEKLSAERELQKKKDELQKLDRNAQEKNESAQREALKRLQRDMEKAAENLEKKPQESQQDQQQRERQASQKLKDAARETGKVDQDKRKQAGQKKMSSQMEDLREALRRAKQRGKKGPDDPFGRNAKNQDFGKRARGQKGSGESWKPGQGQQPGQQQAGGTQQGNGKQWGVGHDDNIAGDPTPKSGNTKDQELQGKEGANGTSRRETILAAAQKGFASTSYKKVYQHYEKIFDKDVTDNEKMPSTYKYYVKRYFAKIHPSGADDSAPK